MLSGYVRYTRIRYTGHTSNCFLIVIDATADKGSLSIDLRRNEFDDARIGKYFSGTSEVNELAAIVNEATNSL